VKLNSIIKSNKANCVLDIIIPSSDNFFEFKQNYKHLFDFPNLRLTLLERNISSEITTFCIKYKINLYERLTDDTPEYYFLYFMQENHLTLSEHILFLYCDEYFNLLNINFGELAKADIFFVRRFELFYSLNSGMYSTQFRGGKTRLVKDIVQSFSYEGSSSFHNFWNFNDNNIYCNIFFSVDHRHQYNMKSDYGKASFYVNKELEVLGIKKISSLKFLRRFVLRFFRKLLNIKLFFINLNIYLFFLISQAIESLLAILLILENRFKNNENNVK